MTAPLASGVKDTQDAITAALAILKAAKNAGNDGWQIKDAILIINDQNLIKTITAALEGAENIMTEMSKLSIFQTMDLVTRILSELPKVLGAR